MSEGKAVYIVSVSYGYVLAHQTKGSPSQTVVQARTEGDDLQKWFIEKTDEEGVVAIRNAKTGCFINCSEQRCWGKIKCDDNRQLWQYDSPDFVHPPGAVRLQPVGFGKVFMNHHGPGRPKRGDAGVAAHMWDWQYDFNTTWYFQTTDKLDGSSMLSAALTGVDGKAGEDVQAKIQDIEAREAALATEKIKQQENLQAQQEDLKAKQKKVEDMEASLADSEKSQKDAFATEKAKQQEDLQAQQKRIRDQEAKLAEAEKAQKAEFETKQKDLADREAALAKREKQSAAGGSKPSAKAAEYEGKLKDLQAREQALAAKEKKDAADKEANLKDIQTREHDLEEREKQLQARETAAAKQPSNGNAKANESKPRAPNDAKGDQQFKELAERLAKLETQLASTQRQPPTTKPAAATPPASRPAATKPATSLPSTQKPATIRPVRTSPGTPHAHTASCGHPLRLPPRKIERKVIGFLYES